MCDGPSVLSRIPTEFRTTMLRFDISAIVVITLIIQSGSADDVNGHSGKYKARFNLWVCDFPSSSFQDHFTVPIHVGLKYVPPIVAKMCVFSELSNIAVLMSGSKVLDWIESFETLQITAKTRL